MVRYMRQTLMALTGEICVIGSQVWLDLAMRQSGQLSALGLDCPTAHFGSWSIFSVSAWLVPEQV